MQDPVIQKIKKIYFYINYKILRVFIRKILEKNFLKQAFFRKTKSP